MVMNKRQAIILVAICALATKLQRLPSLLSLTVMQDGWIVLLALGFADILFACLALWFFNAFNNVGTFYEVFEKIYGKVISKILFIVLFAYFLISAVLPFEAIHDLFANMLFNQINYNYFGLIFIGVLIFSSAKGLQMMGRQIEIYTALVTVGIVGVLAFGLFSADFSKILPAGHTDFSVFINEAARSSLWYGDFMIIFLLTGRVNLKKGENLWLGILLPFASVLLLIVPLAYVAFYSLYNNLAGFQSSAISSLTQFSLLSLDIGRIDWFFVLFEQVSTILSASIYIYLAAECFSQVFAIKRPLFIITLIALVLFLADVFIFKNLTTSPLLFRQVFYVFALIWNYVLPLIYAFSGLVYLKTHAVKREEINPAIGGENYTRREAR